MPHVSNNSNHLQRSSFVVDAGCDFSPKRAGAWPRFGCQTLTDDCQSGAISQVVIGKCLSLQQRNPHGLEVARCDRLYGAVVALSWGHRRAVTVGAVADFPASVGERRVADGAESLHSWQAFDFFFELPQYFLAGYLHR